MHDVVGLQNCRGIGDHALRGKSIAVTFFEVVNSNVHEA